MAIHRLGQGSSTAPSAATAAQSGFHATPTVSRVEWVNAMGGAFGGHVTGAKVKLTLAANPQFERATAQVVHNERGKITIMVDAKSKDRPKPNLQADRLHRLTVDVGFQGSMEPQVKIVARNAHGQPGRQLGSVHKFTNHIPA